MIKNEMKVFERSLDKGKLVYNYLLKIKPSSVESERIFSLSSLCDVTKIRNKINDIIDAMVYLKVFF